MEKSKDQIIQEQQENIEFLEKENARLKERIENAEAKVEQIEFQLRQKLIS